MPAPSTCDYGQNAVGEGSPSPEPAQANHPHWDWGVRGLRAESTTHTNMCQPQTPTSPLHPYVFASPHTVLHHTPHPLICCLAVDFLLQLPPRELKKFIIRNSDDSASWCTTLSCSVAAPQLWLSFRSLFNLCSHSLLSSVLRIHFLCRCRKKWRTCRSDLTKYSDL